VPVNQTVTGLNVIFNCIQKLFVHIMIMSALDAPCSTAKGENGTDLVLVHNPTLVLIAPAFVTLLVFNNLVY
jgi:hypothetical protein